ncbi:MAG: DNA-directed RNA polymerase subunit beta'' [bacterium]
MQIHPLVCAAFNADFDGDQMAVHVPLLTEAQTEASILMLSSNNILSPASGRPLITPTQDMVLGTYYMTVEDKLSPPIEKVYANIWDAMVEQDLGVVPLQARIKVRLGKDIVETTVGRIKFNYTIERVIHKRLPGTHIAFLNRTFDKKSLEKLVLDSYKKYGTVITAELADEIKRLGFKYATIAGISIAVDDLKIPASKKHTVEKANFQSDQLEKSFRDGSITAKEKFLRTLDIWSNVTDKVTSDMSKEYEEKDPLNSVFMMAHSGARGSMQQVRQLAGIRGLMADPSGNIISIPIKTNFKEGLTVTEYFISSYGARKGLVDTALRTADSGYLTRRLVDVAQDVIISEDDCGVEEGIMLSAVKEGFEEIIPMSQRLIGRITVKAVSDPVTGKGIVEKGEEIDEARARDIAEAGIDKIEVRSTMACRTKRGICKKCYGRDLSSGNLVNIGEAIGIIAAQSIGEPGTQLTMRTFHIGGVAVHKPTTVVIKSKHNGKVKFSDQFDTKTSYDENGEKVNVVTRESEIFIEVKDKKEMHGVPVGAFVKVKEGDTVKTGQTLAEYDPSYEYIIAATPGKVRYMKLTVQERKQKFHSGLVLPEKLAQKDGDIFVYNSDVKNSYEFAPDTRASVNPGDRVMIGTELAPDLISPISGIVLDVKSAKGRKGEVIVVPGDVYSIPSGSRVYFDDEAAVSAHAILAKVEAIRRDPSKTRDIIQGLPKVEELFEARRPKDPAILAEIDGTIDITEREGMRYIIILAKGDKREYAVSYDMRLRVNKGDRVTKGMSLTFGTIVSHDVLRILGISAVQNFLVEEIQKIYRGQGVTINDKHIEAIVRQMTKKLRVLRPGDTTLLPGELMDNKEFDAINDETKGEKAVGVQVLLGITKASLSTESFISAASFQETARILTEAAIKGKIDMMVGLKENVIIGKLIPAGTGFSGYHHIDLVPHTGKKKKLEMEPEKAVNPVL